MMMKKLTPGMIPVAYAFRGGIRVALATRSFGAFTAEV